MERGETRIGPRRRQPLSAKTRLADFRNYYWYRAELAAFCRQEGLGTSGRKLDLARRIEKFLATGKRPTKATRRKPRGRTGSSRKGPLTTRTVVTSDFRCGEETRAFFRSVIGDHFHFTAHLQQFRCRHARKGARLTYGDLAREWLAERERRKNKNYKPGIHRSGEYNQFVRDFLADKPRNAALSLSDAARAWNMIRPHRGPRTYAEYLRVMRKA